VPVAADDDPLLRRTYVVAVLAVRCGGWLAAITAGAIMGSAFDLSAAALAVPVCLFTLVVPALATPAGRARLQLMHQTAGSCCRPGP
jgi:hypothetical protein